MASTDRTLAAVQRQLNAMGATGYEVGILGQDDKMMLRTWRADQICSSIGWLKYQNMQRSHIYVRPHGNQGLVMMDDASQAVVRRVHDDGLAPVCVIESSPLNYQIWLRFSLKTIENSLATDIAQYLAHTYDTDPAAADWRRFGRLAGFTNVKPIHVGKDGRSPFSLVSEASGAHVRNPEATIAKATAWQAGRKKQLNLTRDTKPPGDEAAVYFQRQLEGLLKKYGNAYNASKGDWMIASSMAQRGYSRSEIGASMLAFSPDLDSRKRGREQDYVNLTLDAVIARFSD